MSRAISLTFLAFGLALAGPALAGAPPDEAALMHDFFPNTLEVAVPLGGWEAKRYFKADHSYRDMVEGIGPRDGIWSIEDGKLCTLQSTEGAARYCNIGLGKKLGEEWQDADPVTGNTVFFTLKAGR